MRLSRSRWENFIRCPFCFYIKEKHNIDPPSTPRFNINMRVDSLLKEEFDRLRENIQLYPNDNFSNIVNISIRESLGRSLNTSITLLITLMALLLFGGSTIQTFLLVLL